MLSTTTRDRDRKRGNEPYMNNEIFQQARSAYVSKQYEVALEKFTECLQDTSVSKAPGELGLLYHQIGNCLVKLNDPNEAIHAY